MTFLAQRQRGSALIILLGIVAIVGIGFFLFTAFGKGNIASVIPQNKSTPKSKVFTVLEPKPVKDKAVSANISAKDGGELKLTDDKGIEVILTIPPGSLKSDTTIVLSPLAEVPIANYTSSLGNGILIEPVGIQFNPPASLSFDFKPGGDQFIFPSNKVLGVQAPTPTDESRGIIRIDAGTQSVGLTPSTSSVDRTQMSTPISESAAYVPDDIAGDKAKTHAENSAATVSNACTIGNLAALNRALSGSTTNAETFAFRGALRECIDEKIAELEWKCKNDRIHVRRLDFTILEKFIARYFSTSDKLEKLRQLLASCTSEYKIGGYSANGASSMSIEALVCGFIDDTWSGKDKFHIQVDVASFDYGGADLFQPPAFGGNFQVSGQGNVAAGGPGAGLSYPYTGPVANGYFDNDKSFTFTAPGGVVVRTPIILVGDTCLSEPPGGTILPPLEPIP